MLECIASVFTIFAKVRRLAGNSVQDELGGVIITGLVLQQVGCSVHLQKAIYLCDVRPVADDAGRHAVQPNSFTAKFPRQAMVMCVVLSSSLSKPICIYNAVSYQKHRDLLWRLSRLELWRSVLNRNIWYEPLLEKKMVSFESYSHWFHRASRARRSSYLDARPLQYYRASLAF